MATYASTAEAQAYFDNRLNTSAWDSASSGDKSKALEMATEIISMLNYVGVKPDGQVLEFPRGDDATIPQGIINACAEIAMALLDNIDPEKELEQLRLQSLTFASAKAVYDIDNIPEYIAAGVPSGIAWRYLKPYLRDPRTVDMTRAS